MSSTYSTNLAIELIGSGEQAGNWGSTTNTNLGTLIEQAISGYTTYSCTGGTDTLTMTNGADATARNMYIQLSGTGGGTLVVPGTYPNANKKLYFIYNSTSSAITVKVSGQTGVSVPASAKIALVCNGSDIVTAENYMVSPTLLNAALTGTPTAPTAAVGTSTTQIATTQFVQQAGLTGEVKMWATGTAPSGYLFCNGQSVSTTTYAALFAVIAYTYGGSGGSFNVPDFSGRMPIGVNGTYTLASTGGAATTTLSTTNLPSHTHTFSATTGSPNNDLNHRHYVGSRDSTADNGGNYAQEFVSDAGSGYGPNTYTNYVDLNHTHGVSGTTGGTGSGTAVTTISPYLGVYYIIKT
jgi:microcystin-dependent protein